MEGPRISEALFNRLHVLLIANTPRGAKASAITFIHIEATKETGLVPVKYFVCIFEKAPNKNIRNNIDTLQAMILLYVSDFSGGLRL